MSKKKAEKMLKGHSLRKVEQDSELNVTPNKGNWQKKYIMSIFGGRDVTTTTSRALETTRKVEGAKLTKNSSIKNSSGQGRMESVHAQGHVCYYDVCFDLRHLVEGESLHVCGEKAHDLGNTHQNQNANQLS